jgi:tRNA G18 (ribose-2'-O)-methylase SpoU
MRGYFEIGMFMNKIPENLGTLWRSAYQLGANGIFTIGHRYKKQSSDTLKTFRHIPLRQFEDFEQFYSSMPYDCLLVGVEMGGKPLSSFTHPQRCLYLLGAEDYGLPKRILERCHRVVSLEAIRTESYNVAVAGSLVMYNRVFGERIAA